MTLQQAAGYQNRKDIPPQQAAGNYQVNAKFGTCWDVLSWIFLLFLWTFGGD
jgi:hypothetical protein